MIELLIWVLIGICVTAILRGLRRSGWVLQFPLLSAAIFLGWVVPQLIGLRHDPNLPTGSLERAVLMCIFSMLAISIGYAKEIKTRGYLPLGFNTTVLNVAAIANLLVGIYAYYMVLEIGESELYLPSQWTGPITIFQFLTNLLYCAAALALLSYFNRRSTLALAVAGTGLGIKLFVAVSAGRRGELVAVGLAILLALRWYWGWTIPRSWALGGAAAIALLFGSIGDYRAAVLAGNLSPIDALAKIEPAQRYKQVISEGGAELRNLTYTVASVQGLEDLLFAKTLWNYLAFAYVPAQLTSVEFKQSLMFELPEIAYQRYFYDPDVGSTYTGMADAYSGFWYFGALLFYLYARAMKYFWVHAEAGSGLAQLILILNTVNALHAITHHLGWFYIELPLIILSVGPAVYFSKMRIFPTRPRFSPLKS